MQIDSQPRLSDYNFLYSGGQRNQAGVSSHFQDTYNDYQLAQYNNDYNYWLWQQQQEYNKPINQVARLKEAGLNPNYNSIDGTGNVSNIPSSNASVRSHINADKATNLNNYIQLYNALLDGIKTGVASIHEYSQIPADIQTYRNGLKLFMQDKLAGQQIDNVVKGMEAARKAVDDWDYQTNGLSPYSVPNMLLENYINSDSRHNSITWLSSEEKLRGLELSNLLRDYNNKEIQPLQKKEIETRIHNIGLESGLKGKELEWYDKVAKTDMGIKLLNSIGGAFFKLFTL